MAGCRCTFTANGQCLLRIDAANYPKDLKALNFFVKLRRLEHLAALNERLKLNIGYISLNFHESDKADRGKLCAIAETYIERIGFEKQSYLGYKHHDAGHQHIHMVSTRIKSDGSKIDMNNIGRNQSEKSLQRNRIEIWFNKSTMHVSVILLYKVLEYLFNYSRNIRVIFSYYLSR